MWQRWNGCRRGKWLLQMQYHLFHPLNVRSALCYRSLKKKTFFESFLYNSASFSTQNLVKMSFIACIIQQSRRNWDEITICFRIIPIILFFARDFCAASSFASCWLTCFKLFSYLDSYIKKQSEFSRLITRMVRWMSWLRIMLCEWVPFNKCKWPLVGFCCIHDNYL